MRTIRRYVRLLLCTRAASIWGPWVGPAQRVFAHQTISWIRCRLHPNRCSCCRDPARADTLLALAWSTVDHRSTMVPESFKPLPRCVDRRPNRRSAAPHLRVPSRAALRADSSQNTARHKRSHTMWEANHTDSFKRSASRKPRALHSPVAALRSFAIRSLR